MDLVEGPLHRPRGRARRTAHAASAPRRPSAKRRVGRHVVALAVVGLDALDPHLEHRRACAPPAPRRRRGEVDQRAACPSTSARPRGGRRLADEVAAPRRPRRSSTAGRVCRRSDSRSRRALAVGGLEVHPGRHPDHGAHARLRSRRDQRPRDPGTGCGLKRQVLYWVSQGESITIASSGSACSQVALEVLEHVALVLVDVAALPVAVGPLGEQGREAGQAQVVAQPGGGGRVGTAGAGEAARPRTAARPRGARRRSSSSPAPQVSTHRRPAGAREQPRRRRAVALRDARLSSISGGAVGARVAAVGAQAHAPARAGRSASPWRAPRPVSRSLGSALAPARPRAGTRAGSSTRSSSIVTRSVARRSRPRASNGSPPASSPASSTPSAVARRSSASASCGRLAALLLDDDALGEVNQPVAAATIPGRRASAPGSAVRPAGRGRSENGLSATSTASPAARERDRPARAARADGRHQEPSRDPVHGPVAIRLTRARGHEPFTGAFTASFFSPLTRRAGAPGPKLSGRRQRRNEGSNDDSQDNGQGRAMRRSRRWRRRGREGRHALPLDRLARLAKLGIQRSLGLPECATPPEEVYELAKRRGMDFVTITDHDTIDGCLEIADRPDVFVSEELTAWFAGEPQAVHVLCYGIEPGRPRVPPGARRATSRRAPPTCTSARSPARSPIRSSPSPRRSARATGAASPSCSRSGRSATARAPGS